METRHLSRLTSQELKRRGNQGRSLTESWDMEWWIDLGLNLVASQQLSFQENPELEVKESRERSRKGNWAMLR
jgi:hypothetical protein